MTGKHLKKNHIDLAGRQPTPGLLDTAFLMHSRDVLNSWVSIRVGNSSESTDHISHQGPTPPQEPAMGKGLAWLAQGWGLG